MLIRKIARVLKSVFTNEHITSKMQSTLDTADSNMYNNKKHKKL
ncbi:hypothetical protein [Clostridium sulfidigenes]